MRPAVILSFFVLAIACAAHAQSPGDTASSTPPPSAAAQQPNPPANSANSAQQPDAPITLKHRPSEAPDAPLPKSDDARAACPAGNGKPCAILGGRVYYSDAFGLSQHNKSWTAAATSPPMLLSVGLLTAATIADIETTHSCIQAGACKEGNPLMGQSRAQAYPVSMSVNAIAFWAAAEQKRHGHGAVPFFILWTATAMHAAMAARNASLNSK